MGKVSEGNRWVKPMVGGMRARVAGIGAAGSWLLYYRSSNLLVGSVGSKVLHGPLRPGARFPLLTGIFNVYCYGPRPLLGHVFSIVRRGKSPNQPALVLNLPPGAANRRCHFEAQQAQALAAALMETGGAVLEIR